MAMSSPIRVIPGSFGSEFGQSDPHILAPKLDVNVGARSHIFQPPHTPSASSSLIQSCALSDYQTPGVSGGGGGVGGGRKRSRHDDSIHQDRVFNRRGRPGWSVYETSRASSTAASPAPLANSRYRLAGGVDRPGGVTRLSDGNGRGRPTDLATESIRAGTKRGFDEDDYDDYGFHSFTPTSNAYRRDGALNGGHMSPSDQSREGWTRMVLDVVGTVAGRVWEFCRAGAFRGFYAGGGGGYAMNAAADEDRHDGRVPIRHERNDGDTLHSELARTAPAVASPVAEPDLAGSYVALDQSPRRASKRLQREKGESVSSDRWIVVSTTTSPSSLDRRTTRASEAGMQGRANVRKSRVPLERVAASRPGRRPGLAVTTPTRPARPPASYASPRASPSPLPLTDAALDSPETRRLMAQHRRRERATDASIQHFNARLKAMIQQGKEALGTTYSIEDEVPGGDPFGTDGDDDASDDMMDF